MTRRKIGLIGSGNVGATLAHLILLKGLGEVFLVDLAPGVAHGKALDLQQSCAAAKVDGYIRGGHEYSLIEGAEVVVVTAGFPRKPGMSRDDLLIANAKVIREVGKHIRNYCPQAFVIVVTNPLDAMVWVMQHETQIPSSHVVGMAGVLDSARYCALLSQAVGVSAADISAMVLGGHGDTMVPLLRYTTIAGVPLTEFIAKGWISREQVESIVDNTRNGGGEIVSLLNTSAYYAPAMSTLQMIAAYLLDQKRILSCAAKLKGEYGVHNLYVGVPAVIGSGGVEKIVELDTAPEELQAFMRSVTAVQKLGEDIERLGL